MRLINNHTQPVTLEDGTILAAAGTDGSTKEVETLSDKDKRRYLDTGLIAIEPVPVEPEPRTKRGAQPVQKEEEK